MPIVRSEIQMERSVTGTIKEGLHNTRSSVS